MRSIIIALAGSFVLLASTSAAAMAPHPTLQELTDNSSYVIELYVDSTDPYAFDTNLNSANTQTFFGVKSELWGDYPGDEGEVFIRGGFIPTSVSGDDAEHISLGSESPMLVDEQTYITFLTRHKWHFTPFTFGIAGVLRKYTDDQDGEDYAVSPAGRCVTNVTLNGIE